MTQYECLVCKGSGEVPNPDFEQCAQLNDETAEGKCQGCVYFTDCSKGETIECDNCDGNGVMILHPDKWKLIAVTG